MNDGTNFTTPTWSLILGAIGFWGGVIIAVYLKKHFWAGLGLALIGTFALSAVGAGIDKMEE